MCLLITCEFSGETIPPWIRSGNGPLESSVDASVHGASLRPFDPPGIATQWEQELVGKADRPARYAAEKMSAQLRPELQAELIVNETPSGLIDVARPRNHRQLLSKPARSLPPQQRDRLIELVYDRYRQRIRSAVGAMLSAHGCAIHLSVRSFNLRSFNSRGWGKPRRTDVGLLYDPASAGEVAFCLDWIDEMWHRAPMLRVRRNYPRRGTGESLIKQLRAEFAGQTYLGIEVWLNRAWASREVRLRDEAIRGMIDSLGAILAAELPAETLAA